MLEARSNEKMQGTASRPKENIARIIKANINGILDDAKFILTN